MKAHKLAALFDADIEQYENGGDYFVFLENGEYRLDFEFDSSGENLKTINVVRKARGEDVIVEMTMQGARVMPEIERMKEDTNQLFNDLFKGFAR